MQKVSHAARLTAKGGFRARQRVKGRIDGEAIATTLLSSGEGWLGLVVNYVSPGPHYRNNG